jgi:hypothetical protein
MGTALAFVAGSAVSCPAWSARVSSFFGAILFSPFEGITNNGVILVFAKNIPKRILPNTTNY